MNKEFIHRLTELVEVNLANEHFGPEDLAKEMGMSHSNLHRKLKSATNQTISQFIREIRLKKAKELLLNEDLTAAEISYRVGFGSPTYFNKCFHEYFGHAPGEMRNHEQDQEHVEIVTEIAADTGNKKPSRRKMWIALIILSIFLIPLSYFLINRVSGSNAEKSIAVLPFKYLSDEPGKQYLADGMMDDITTHLSKIKDLRVLSSTSVEQYRKTDKTAKVIGKELGVAYLLEGSLQKEGDKIRLIMQLIKTGEEGHAWANEYDRQWKDIFSVQSEVAETIASELQAAIAPNEKQLIRKIPTADLTAYDFYQQGKHEYDKTSWFKFDSVPLVKAQNLFRKALVYDSTFAQAYVGLARIRWDKTSMKDRYLTNYYDSVLILANRAISFDNQLAETYCIRGLYYFVNSNVVQAIKDFDKGIELNPNDWESYFNKGLLLQFNFDDYRKAIEYYLKASVRNRGKELVYILSKLGTAYQDIGFLDKAKKYYQESFILGGDSASYYFALGVIEFLEGNFENELIFQKKAYAINLNAFYLAGAYFDLGRYKEANLYYEKGLAISKKSGNHLLNGCCRIGYSYQKVGKLKEAEYYYNQTIKDDLESIKLNRWDVTIKFVYYDLAAVYAAMGDKGKAYENLDELNKKQSFGWEWMYEFKRNPLFNSIRQEPRFQKIAAELEAKSQAEHERVRKWLEENKML